MLNYFTELFAHEAWANRELLTMLAAIPALPSRVEALCAHIIATHRFWELRLSGQSVAGHTFWPELSLAECAAGNDAFAERWAGYVGNLPAPIAEQRITYRGLDGKQTYTFFVTDILTQLHSHGVHHRAQILPLLRDAGIEPPNVDYIRYCLKHGSVDVTD